MRLITTLEKRSTSLFQPVKRKTRLDQLQLARAFWEKGEATILFSRRESALWAEGVE